MEKKLIFLAVLCVVILLPLSGVFSTTKDEVIKETLNNLAQNLQKSSLTPATKSESNQVNESNDDPNNIPDWLKRTSYGVFIETDQKPRIYLETVQPIYQSFDQVNTFFTHDRISIQEERGTYSVGLGYRRLLFDNNLLAGINTFFDYQDLHQHYRQGLGLEAITKTLEFRTNSYFRLSPKRRIESTTTSDTFERVANGNDVEIGGPIPYLPWIKIFSSYYRYNFRKFKDMSGWKMRGEIKPFKFITINLQTYDDNKGDREYLMDTRFNLVFDDLSPKSILSAFKLTKEPYPGVNLKERTLDRVERNFNIQVEKWIESSGFTVEIGRGSN